MPDHESHLFRGHGFRCNDQVSFILSIFVIEHDHELSVAYMGMEVISK